MTGDPDLGVATDVSRNFDSLIDQSSPFGCRGLHIALNTGRNLDLGLGTSLNFGRAEHQASHKIWGTAIDDNGRYQPIELE